MSLWSIATRAKKIIHSSTFHSMMFLFHTYWDFFLTDQNISKMGSKRLAVKKTFFVRSETWMILLLGVNLSLFEIKSFFGIYSAFSFILLKLGVCNSLVLCNLSTKEVSTLYYRLRYFNFQCNFLKLKTPKHCSWNCAGLLLKPFIQLLL